MPLPKDINEYLCAWAPELGERILQTYPPLQSFDDAVSPLTGQLLHTGHARPPRRATPALSTSGATPPLRDRERTTHEKCG